MTFDWTVNLGHILTFLGVAGGLWVWARQHTKDTSLIAERLQVLGGRVINVETELKELNQVVTALAVQDARIVAMEARQSAQGERISAFERSADEWRRLMVEERLEK